MELGWSASESEGGAVGTYCIYADGTCIGEVSTLPI